MLQQCAHFFCGELSWHVLYDVGLRVSALRLDPLKLWLYLLEPLIDVLALLFKAQQQFIELPKLIGDVAVCLRVLRSGLHGRLCAIILQKFKVCRNLNMRVC